MASSTVRERLAAGPKRGLGCANAVAIEAVCDGGVLRDLVEALQDERATVVSRAANALKKAQKRDPRALDEFAAELISAGLSCTVLQARWNLWLLLGGLRMTARQKGLAVDTLFRALASESALERVHAMQSLANLSVGDAAMRGRVRQVVARALEDASAAVRARARRLKMAH